MLAMANALLQMSEDHALFGMAELIMKIQVSDRRRITDAAELELATHRALAELLRESKGESDMDQFFIYLEDELPDETVEYELFGGRGQFLHTVLGSEDDYRMAAWSISDQLAELLEQGEYPVPWNSLKELLKVPDEISPEDEDEYITKQVVEWMRLRRNAMITNLIGDCALDYIYNRKESRPELIETDLLADDDDEWDDE